MSDCYSGKSPTIVTSVCYQQQQVSGTLHVFRPSQHVKMVGMSVGLVCHQSCRVNLTEFDKRFHSTDGTARGFSGKQ